MDRQHRPPVGRAWEILRASDKPSDNNARQQQTKRDALRYPHSVELR